jgi:hypothetical protein
LPLQLNVTIDVKAYFSMSRWGKNVTFNRIIIFEKWRFVGVRDGSVRYGSVSYGDACMINSIEILYRIVQKSCKNLGTNFRSENENKFIVDSLAWVISFGQAVFLYD